MTFLFLDNSLSLDVDVDCLAFPFCGCQKIVGGLVLDRCSVVCKIDEIF